MNLDRLQLFLHIVDQGSISAAAHVAYLTQSAISRSLQQLEEEIGTKLFERQHKRLILTTAGRALVPEARELLERAARVQARISSANDGRRFNLRIGTIACAGQYLLPEVLLAMKEEFPELVLKVQTGRSPTLIDALRRDDIDMALVASRGEVSDTRNELIGAYRLHYYGARDRYDDLARVSSFDDLSNFPLASIQLNPGEIGPRAGPLMHEFVVNDCSTLKALVLSGLAVGDLVHYMLSPEELSRLVVAPIHANVSCQLYLLLSKNWSDIQANKISRWIKKRLVSVHTSHSI